MSYLGRLPPRSDAQAYARMDRQLQASIMENGALKDRVAMVEAEARALREDRDKPLEERGG